MSDFHKATLTFGVLCLLAGMSEWVSRQVVESIAFILYTI